MPRWPTAECSGLLYYLLCFLCFLAAPTCIADRESNSLPGTLLQSSSSFYLLWSSVQILWMLTDFWSLNGTPTHTDHQLSNAWLFDKSHYWGSKQQKPNLKNMKTKSPLIRMWEYNSNLYKIFLQRITSMPSSPLKFTSPSQLTVSHMSLSFMKRCKLVCLIYSTF